MIAKNKDVEKEYARFMEFSKLAICFMLYSIFGWLYEVFLEVVIYQWGYSDRGVLFGPYCPIYGVGAILFLLVFYKYKNDSDKKLIVKLITIFLGSMLIATLIELTASYILEFTTGSWPWQTYKDYAVNFQGRIALSPSVRFGIGGILFLYVLQPIFDYMLSKLNKKSVDIIGIIVVVILGADIIWTICNS